MAQQGSTMMACACTRLLMLLVMLNGCTRFCIGQPFAPIPTIPTMSPPTPNVPTPSYDTTPSYVATPSTNSDPHIPPFYYTYPSFSLPTFYNSPSYYYSPSYYNSPSYYYSPSYYNYYAPTIPTPPQPPLPPSLCEDCPEGWYDIDGPFYSCAWYAENDYCDSSVYYVNFGYDANQACCGCGGGRELGTCEVADVTPPTFAPTTPAPSSGPCIPFVEGWYDSDGSDFTCEWYGLNGGACEAYGNDFANFGYTANENCCECGGGNTNFEPTVSPAPTGECQDCEDWHDAFGSFYDCAWYEAEDFCEYAQYYPWRGYDATDACCYCGKVAGTTCDYTGGSPTYYNPTPSYPSYSPYYYYPSYYGGSPAPVNPNCRDEPLGWYDSDGPDYDCEWYGEANFCSSSENYPNFGTTAEEACCVCGGGIIDECEDDPVGWYDSDGPEYDCEWYGDADYCSSSQYYPNFGTTAEEACCVCGGGKRMSLINAVMDPATVGDADFSADDGSWVVTDGSPVRVCGEGVESLFGDCYYHFEGGSGDQRIEQIVPGVEDGTAGEVFDLMFYAMGVDLPGKKVFKGYIKTKTGGSRHAYPCRSTRDGSFDFRLMKCKFIVEEDFEAMKIVFKYMGDSGHMYLDKVMLDRAQPMP